MRIQIQRTYHQDHTEYKAVGYDFEPVIVCQGGKEMLANGEIKDEFESKVMKLFKNKVAELLVQDVQFEFYTAETKKEKEEQKLLPEGKVCEKDKKRS